MANGKDAYLAVKGKETVAADNAKSIAVEASSSSARNGARDGPCDRGRAGQGFSPIGISATEAFTYRLPGKHSRGLVWSLT